MTNKEILEKVIQKAIDGGWKEPSGNTLRVDDSGNLFCFINGATDGIKAYGFQFNLERLIYSHDFVKALWRDKDIDSYLDTVSKNTGIKNKYHPWQIHLQNMVIAEDPIAYLGENI